MINEFTQALPALAKQLGHTNLEVLLALAQIHERPQGSHLTEDGQPVNALILLLGGVCAVSIDEQGEQILLGKLGAGQWIGEISLFSEARQATSTVTAETDVRVLELKHADFDRLRAENLGVASSLVRVLVTLMADRLRHSGDLLQKRAAGGFGLPGSDQVQQSDGEHRGWFTRVLRRAFGLSDKEH